MAHNRCLRWSALGGLLGAATAYAQAPAPVPEVVDPLAAVLVELARVSPLAMILAVLAFGLARLGPPTIRVVIAEDESTTAKRVEALERQLRGGP